MPRTSHLAHLAPRTSHLTSRAPSPSHLTPRAPSTSHIALRTARRTAPSVGRYDTRLKLTSYYARHSSRLTPCTSLPVPHTLHFEPRTSHPALQTPHLTPCCTSNPAPHSLHFEPRTFRHSLSAPLSNSALQTPLITLRSSIALRTAELAALLGGSGIFNMHFSICFDPT